MAGALPSIGYPIDTSRLQTMHKFGPFQAPSKFMRHRIWIIYKNWSPKKRVYKAEKNALSQ